MTQPRKKAPLPPSLRLRNHEPRSYSQLRPPKSFHFRISLSPKLVMCRLSARPISDYLEPTDHRADREETEDFCSDNPNALKVFSV